jgi:hypothetical protein
MLTLAKFVLGCFVVGALTLAGSSLLPPSMRTELGLETATSQADFMLRRVGAQFPTDIHTFSASTGAFVRSNATTARLQLEGMKNSLPSSFALGSWMPSSTSSWIQNGAQLASQAAGSKPGTFAKKIPVVNGAVNSANEHIAALRQSLNNAAANF